MSVDGALLPRDPGRVNHLRTVFDLRDSSTIERVLLRAQALKNARAERRLAPTLSGRVIGMLFQRPSTRTVASFESGVALLGGATVLLHGRDTQLSSDGQAGEPLRDAARVLGGYVDALVARMGQHADVLEFARHARVPVVNGGSEREHPCQAVTDLLTVFERREQPFALQYAYVGEVTGALCGMAGLASMCGFRLRIAVPGELPEDLSRLVAQSNGRIERAATAIDGVKNADVVMTHAWNSLLSLPDDARGAARERLWPYRLDAALLQGANENHLVLHPLPAARGQEITDDVLEGMHSVAFEQAKNRLPVQQALLEHLLAVAV